MLDTIFTATNVGSVIYVETRNDVANKGTAMALGLSVAALWAVSASYGYSKTSQCDDAKETVAHSLHPPLRRTRAPPSLLSPPGPPPGQAPYAPSAPEGGQQQDDDDPSFHRPPPPPSRKKILTPPPDAPRFGG